MDTVLSVDALSRSLQESYFSSGQHRFVDPREPYYDMPGFGWLSRSFGYYTRLDDRIEGKYIPVYENELDLKAIRMANWLMDAEVPVAKAMKNRLRDYTVSTGFDWQISHDRGESLEKRLTDIVDTFFENSGWVEDLEGESFEREFVDGEFISELVESEGDICLNILEGDNLTEPIHPADLEDWRGYDFPTSWSFGVLTEIGRPSKPKAYHVVRNNSQSDWDLVEPYRFVHWKRNVTRNAKRGAGDNYTSHKWLGYGAKTLSNTAQGAAIQAAIAYIVEHAPGVSASQANALASARSRLAVEYDTVSGETYKKRNIRPGHVVDVKSGSKFHAGLLGSNNSQIYIDVMSACFRLAGTIYAMPEHMITGYAGNNNRASSETAESPFIQGRYMDQRIRSRRVRRLIMQVLEVASEDKRNKLPDWEELKLGLEVTVNPPDIVSRDEAAMVESQLKLMGAGLQSRRGASNLVGVDYEEAQEQIKQEQDEAIKREQEVGRIGFQGERQPPAGPGGGGDTQPPGSPGGALGGGSGVGDSPSSETTKEVTPEGLGPASVSGDDLDADGLDASWEIPDEDLADLVEGFDPLKHPRGKDGKFIHSGVKTGHWKKTNSAAQAAIKKINYMEGLAAQGKWADLNNAAPWPVSKKTGLPQPESKLNSYQLGIQQAKKNLMKLKDEGVKDGPPDKGWKKVGKQLGSNPGGQYEGPDGKKYYVKQPADPGHAAAEVLTSKLYEAAGAGVVDAELVKIDGKTSVATRWIDTSEKIQWTKGDQVEASSDFAVHAWLANWDAIGHPAEKDNIRSVPQADGTIKFVAVDVGGSLNYRAQGGKKDFNTDVPEWDTLRDSSVNPSAGSVFGGMTEMQMVHSAKKLEMVDNATIKDLVNKYHDPSSGMSKVDMSTMLVIRRDKIINKGKELEAKLTGAPKVAATGQQAKPQPQADLKSTVPPVMPAKPFIPESNASYQKHVDAITGLAAKGDTAGLNAYKTNATSTSTYTKKVHDYKVACLSALGAKADPATAKSAHVDPPKSKPKPKPTVATFKVKVDDLPAPPELLTKQAEIKASNELLMSKWVGMAAKGDLAGIEALKPPEQSSKLKSYHADLLGSLKMQLNDHLNPPVPYDSSKAGALVKGALAVKHDKVTIDKAKDAIGNWVIHGRVEGYQPPSVIESSMKWGEVDWEGSSSPLVKKALKQSRVNLDAIPDQERMALRRYTGHYYEKINNSLRTGKGITPMAKRAVAAVHKAKHELPQGVTLGRRHYLDGNGLNKLLEVKPGTVVSDPGLLSTSHRKDSWHGSVHWRFDAAPGAKGVFVEGISSHSTENEVVLSPHSRFVIHKVTKVDSSQKDSKKIGTEQYVVHATLLPDVD